MNDRTLRTFDAHIKKDIVMKSKFVITAASEMMAIFTLSKDLDDFRERVDNIIIG